MLQRRNDAPPVIRRAAVSSEQLRRACNGDALRSGAVFRQHRR
jgi:hypothetical protein